jgi:hypothetical protein
MGPIDLFPLKSGKDGKMENEVELKEKPSRWDPPSCLPSRS